MIRHIVRLNPFRLLSSKKVFVSQVLHRFDSISNIRGKNSLSVIESMVTSVIDLSGFNATHLLALCVDSVMEGLAHDSFACALQILLGSLIASHGVPSLEHFLLFLNKLEVNFELH